MESTRTEEENRKTTHLPDGTNIPINPEEIRPPADENTSLETREDQTPSANNPPISTTSTETEAIMRYILLLERTQTQLQKTERIMDKLSGQLGSAIAVTENQVKSRKPLSEKRDGGNAPALDGRDGFGGRD